MVSEKNLWVLGAIVVILIVARFVILQVSPPGFYVDEAASQRHVESMLESQTNANGEPWPFYSLSLGGGFTTPIYLYPLVAWSAVFGTDPTAIRAFSQFFGILAVLVAAFAVRLHFGRAAGYVAAVVGLALPWGWLQGSLAWDPVLVPFTAALALLGWSLLVTQKQRGRRVAGFVLLPLGLLLLAYVYPPYWAVVPFLTLGAYLLLLKLKKITWPKTFATAGAMAIGFIPLVFFILSPSTLGRTSSISIFHDATLPEAAGMFINNMVLMLNPVFLFVTGDANGRQSTSFEGMLGFAALIPLLVLAWAVIVKWIRKSTLLKANEYFIVKVAAVAYLLSLIGSALTAEGQPHSLRSCAAWIFAVVLITVGWIVLTRLKSKALLWIAIIVAALGTVAYAVDLAFFFPERGKASYSVIIPSEGAGKSLSDTV